MSRLSSALRLAVMAVMLGNVGCSRADVYPVTLESPADGGPTGGGGLGGLGGGGLGGGGLGGGGLGSGGLAGGGLAGGGLGGGGLGGGGLGGGGLGGGGTPSGCPADVLSPGDTNQMVLADATMRRYVLHVPPGYDGLTPVPLVVDYHGIGESGASERSNSPYPSVLDPEGVIMAFPDGLRGPAGTAWNVGPCCVADVDDVAFTRALVAHVQQIACIDPSRVYAVGVLTGGGMAHYLGCYAGDLFAAVAPAAFDLLEEYVDDCNPPRPVTVVSFRGTEDPRVPYAGGPSALVPGMPLTFLGAQGTFEKWAEIDQCVGPPSLVDENGCSGYSGCADGAEVILCTKEGGGDDPGDPNISWPVLKRHTL